MSSNLVKNKQLPKGWLPTIIGDLLDFEYGKGLTKKKRNENGKFPVYGSNGIVGYHTNFLIEAPALIIGRKGAAGEVSYSDKNCWPIDTTYFINNLNYLNIKFVFYVLKSLRLNQYDRSTAIPGLNRDDAYELSFNLPPIPEQNQIVAEIEELFSELDNGIENLKKAWGQLKIYHQAVLKYAFEGKLTKEWRTLQRRAGNPPEPAEKLLEQIKTEREKHYQKQLEDWGKAVKKWEANGKIVKKPAKPKRFKDMPEFSKEESESLTLLPKSWEWIRINESVFDLNDDIVDGPFGSNLKNSDYVDDGTVPVIGISNIDEGFKTKIRYVTKEKFETISRSAVYPGNIIVAKIGSSYGKTGIYPEWMPVGLIPANLIRLKPSKHFIRELLVHYLQSSIFKKRLDKIMKSSAQPAYNVSIFRNLPVPFCSIEEQKELLKEIESRLSVCDQLEQTVEDSLKKAEALRQSILKKAFAGGLTRDWREKHPELITGENSAEKLLERIKAEKALSAAGLKKPQSKKTKKK